MNSQRLKLARFTLPKAAEENLSRINELWARPICDFWWFAVHERYCLFDERIEMRLAVSFGPNPFPPTPRGYVLCPSLPADFVFGIHDVGTIGDGLTLYDIWMDAVAGDDCTTLEQVQAKAERILADFPDEQYLNYVSEKPRKPNPLLPRSPSRQLGDFVIHGPEAF